jgi:hypothetical protein
MALFSKKRQVGKSPVIDLREPLPGAVPIVFGQPAPCPECGSPGYLDSIDPSERVMYQHCPSCLARWTIAEADIADAWGADSPH